jgi:hypothetical protein
VRLDPHGTCRIARLRSAVVQAGALQQVAQALRAAVLEKLAADRANTARARA